MKILYAIATLAFLSTPAAADGWDVVEQCTYSKFFGRTCTTSYRDAPAHNPALEQEEQKAKRTSVEKWEAFCKPTRTLDNEGVVRLVYAKKGCEFGRSE
jgi:hypothetical protein